MDWIWRILLSLFAVNLIVNAKYFPIWDDLALVTLILQASIITFGTLPFLIKILNALMGLGKKSSKSKKPSTADILKESEADDRARSAHLQPPADSTPQIRLMKKSMFIPRIILITARDACFTGMPRLTSRSKKVPSFLKLSSLVRTTSGGLLNTRRKKTPLSSQRKAPSRMAQNSLSTEPTQLSAP